LRRLRAQPCPSFQRQAVEAALRPPSIEPQAVALALLPQVAAQAPLEELPLQSTVERWTQTHERWTQTQRVAVRLPFSDRPG